MRKIKRIFNTLRFLKIAQIYYQVVNRLKREAFVSEVEIECSTRSLHFACPSFVFETAFNDNKFVFLNLEMKFEKTIDWNFNEFGKLWTYNLEYFNYLSQSSISKEYKLFLLEDFYNFSIKFKRPLEPYPVSVRSINIIRFLNQENLHNNFLLQSVFCELEFLNENYEFHLYGNHLLENCFAMMMGGVFFNMDEWVVKAQKVLRKEMFEQILDDGGHFELSPMYHNIIFYRVLEFIDWYSSYPLKDNDFLNQLKLIAGKMRSWLENIMFSNFDIPMFNDSSAEIAFDAKWLLDYSELLSVNSSKLPLSDSGFRSISTVKYEIRIDCGPIGASYQPGHAHADAFSFILYSNGLPIFVEVGTSTYNQGIRRMIERSTLSHNTVVVNDTNQSDVWGGFRVGQRANVFIIKDRTDTLEVMHDGYKSLGVMHQRTFDFLTNQILITDRIGGKHKKIAYFHLFPGISCFIKDNIVSINNDGINIIFSGAKNIKLEKYLISNGFNVLEDSERIVIEFENELLSNIIINK